MFTECLLSIISISLEKYIYLYYNIYIHSDITEANGQHTYVDPVLQNANSINFVISYVYVVQMKSSACVTTYICHYKQKI